MTELAIRGGQVVDGTGAAPVDGDVVIRDGRVAEVGPGAGKGIRDAIDASGHVVAPGFIDIHTHYDAQVFWDPAITPSCFHGVTTVVAGNCGFSIAPTRTEHHEVIARTLENVEDMDVASLAEGIPWDFATFPEYLSSVERRGTGLNFAAYIGHTPLRLFVMGDEAYERLAKPEEVEQMRAVLREAMEGGAAGFATSFSPTHRGVDGKPIPSRHADRAEFEALIDVVGDVGRGVVAIAPGEQCSIADLYELQPRVGVPFTYGALLTTPTGMHRKMVDLNQAGWARGAEVWPQVSPRPLVFAMTLAEPFTFNLNEEFAALMPLSFDERRRAYADPAWRQRVLEAWDRGSTFSKPRWQTIEIDQSPAHPELEGRRLTQIAEERGASAFDALMDLTLDEPDLCLRVRTVLANDDTDEVAKLLVESNCTLGLSDAGAHIGQLCDAVQATDFLGKWVRERNLMPIEAAVRKLTGVQADLLGVPDRGYLRPGAWADVVVFDFDTVDPGPIRRVRDFPANAERLTADQPTGIRDVLVNGTPVQRDGARVDNDVRPGQVVRPARRK